MLARAVTAGGFCATAEADGSRLLPDLAIVAVVRADRPGVDCDLPRFFLLVMGDPAGDTLSVGSRW